MPMSTGMRFDPTQPAFWLVIAAAIGVALGIVTLGGASAEGGTPALRALEPAAVATNPRDELVAASSGAVSDGALVADRGGSSAAARQAGDATPTVTRRGGIACDEPHVLVKVDRPMPITRMPGGHPIGTMPASSRYLGAATTAWVQSISANGRYGRVALPWVRDVRRTGWIDLTGLERSSTRTLVVSDLSERRLRVYDGCAERFSASTAIGRPGSPSPTGAFWVTDRVPVPGAQQGSFGTFAFGLSTIQPHLPAGWTGGDQMAIHGTGAPGSIGAAASAGCLRVSEATLARLKPLLRVGTPVVITA